MPPPPFFFLICLTTNLKKIGEQSKGIILMRLRLTSPEANLFSVSSIIHLTFTSLILIPILITYILHALFRPNGELKIIIILYFMMVNSVSYTNLSQVFYCVFNGRDYHVCLNPLRI